MTAFPWDQLVWGFPWVSGGPSPVPPSRGPPAGRPHLHPKTHTWCFSYRIQKDRKFTWTVPHIMLSINARESIDRHLLGLWRRSLCGRIAVTSCFSFPATLGQAGSSEMSKEVPLGGQAGSTDPCGGQEAIWKQDNFQDLDSASCILLAITWRAVVTMHMCHYVCMCVCV